MSDQAPANTTPPQSNALNRYDVSGRHTPASGSFPNWQAQSWDAVGWGAGNRKADTLQSKPNKPNEPATIANASMGMPTVAQASLAGIRTESSNNGGNGFYHDSTAGSVVQRGWGDADFNAKDEWGEAAYGRDGFALNVRKARAAAGVREQIGVRGSVSETGWLGTASAKGDAALLAEAGVDANGTIGTTGIQGSANAGARAGASITGDADLRTPGLVIDGVTTPLSAGVGVHGDGFAGARIGAGIKGGIGPSYTGLEGKIGGMAGAEGNVDVHSHLGPLRAKLGATGIAGIGAEASGGISLEDWNLRMGGRLGAAFGLGGSVSFDANVDLRQTAQLAMAAGRQLTPAQLGQTGASAMEGGAQLADSGWHGVRDFLDPEGTGRFSMHGLGVRGERIGAGINNAAGGAMDWAGASLSNARDFAGNGIAAAGQGLGNAWDATRHAVTNPGETLSNARDWAGNTLSAAGQGLSNARDFAGNVAGGARDWAGNRLSDAQDLAGNTLSAAGQGLGNAWDATRHAVTNPGETLSNARNWAGNRLSDARNLAGNGITAAGQGLGNAWDATRHAVTNPGETLSNARNWAGNRLNDARGLAGNTISAAGQGLSNARDFAGNVATGARDWAGSQLNSAGRSLSTGASNAWGSLKNTGRDVAGFFGF